MIIKRWKTIDSRYITINLNITLKILRQQKSKILFSCITPKRTNTLLLQASFTMFNDVLRCEWLSQRWPRDIKSSLYSVIITNHTMESQMNPIICVHWWATECLLWIFCRKSVIKRFHFIMHAYQPQNYKNMMINPLRPSDAIWQHKSSSTLALEMDCCHSLEGKPRLPGHYDDVIMSAIASQFTILTIVYSIVYSDADQRKHQSSASLAFVRGIHRGPVNSPHKWQVARKMFPFDDVIMGQRVKTC